jgi:calcineurin-like phosphoesterase family protein
MKTLFTSDLHLNHHNIIKYCNRPYKDVEEMNFALIDNYNKKVNPEDTCYIIGDVAMGKKDQLPGLVKQLNGKKILISGNHDRNKSAMLQAGFDEVYDNLIIDQKINGRNYKVYLVHNPMEITKDIYYDTALVGHVHSSWARKGKVINVGVDVSDYRPLTFQELLIRDIEQP